VFQVRNHIVQKWIIQRNSPILFWRFRGVIDSGSVSTTSPVARWWTHWVITKRNDWPTTLCTTLNYVNPVPYPSIDTILIKLCFVNHRVLYNIESSTILMTLIDKNVLKLPKICPVLADMNTSIALHKNTIHCVLLF
jgi:hypothetical protein